MLLLCGVIKGFLVSLEKKKNFRWFLNVAFKALLLYLRFLFLVSVTDFVTIHCEVFIANVDILKY